MSLTKKAFLFIGIILLIDQISKFLVKTNLHLGEQISVFGDWFYIYFTENPGMAFGMSFGGPIGKMFLVLFRIVLAGALIFYIPKLTRKQGMTTGFIMGMAGICAGALGNIIDSAFYGMIYDTGTTFNTDHNIYLGYQGISTLSTAGYSSFMHGCVVDMLYFPVIKTTLPDWFPVNAGEEFVFFRPIFNIADSAITVSVLYLLLFQRKAFKLFDKK
jgi:signal peptidase II